MRTNLKLVAVVALMLAVVGSSSAWAQSTTTLRGTVRDGYGSPIAAAEVMIDAANLRTRTADDGSYQLRRVPIGEVTVTARRLGFLAKNQTLVLSASDDNTANWSLRAATTQMRPVAVTARRDVSDSRLEGFRSRLEAKRSGYFITRDRIEQSQTRSLTDALRGVPGVRVGGETRTGTHVYFRGQRCSPVVFIDGFAATATQFDFGSLDLNMVEGIEVYMSNTSMPADFMASRGLDNCGAVAIWSRPAQPRMPVVNPNAITSHEEITATLARAGAFLSNDVDEVAEMIGGDPGVAYPESMWRTGVSGEATLEFVVDASGRINWKTLSVVSATNEMFSRAVKEALVKSRWDAAVRGGKRVAQIVQLPVHFSRFSATPTEANMDTARTPPG